MSFSILNTAAWVLALPLGAALSQGLPLELSPEPASTSLSSVEVASDWVANDDDHICGLSALRALSDPAKVDYPELWEATPEIKRMKDEAIDPDSAEGIQLQQAAKDRILDACKSVQNARNHCSVWKAIEHEDGRSIPDITKKVKAKFSQ